MFNAIASISSDESRHSQTWETQEVCITKEIVASTTTTTTHTTTLGLTSHQTVASPRG